MYNGWRNYPTWATNLWLTNEPWTYRAWLAQAREAMGETGGNASLAEAFLADSIREQMELDSPLDEPGPYTDILSWALGEVDYTEIARALIDAAAEELAEDPGEGADG